MKQAKAVSLVCSGAKMVHAFWSNYDAMDTLIVHLIDQMNSIVMESHLSDHQLGLLLLLVSQPQSALIVV